MTVRQQIYDDQEPRQTIDMMSPDKGGEGDLKLSRKAKKA
jgi:hypothetical protein